MRKFICLNFDDCIAFDINSISADLLKSAIVTDVSSYVPALINYLSICHIISLQQSCVLGAVYKKLEPSGTSLRWF